MFMQVTIGGTDGRSVKTVDSEQTLRTVLEESNINYNVGTTTINGAPLLGSIDDTLNDLGIQSGDFVLQVVNTKNA